jgi:FixJ family two-component response regulator
VDIPATVYVVDDDAQVRRALERLLRAMGYRVSAFGSAADFLAAHDPDCTGCIVLDVAMPDCGGLDLQKQLKESGRERPIIFLTGHGSIPLSVQAMKAGAVTFLTKPITERDLAAVVSEAITLDRASRQTRATQNIVLQRLGSLTRRERQVLQFVVEGRLNKQIAAELGTVEQTVKVHRARVMKKMGARSVAELVRYATSVEWAMAQRLPARSADDALAMSASLQE